MNTKHHSSFIRHPSSFWILLLALFTATPRAPAQTSWGNALSFNGSSQYVTVPPDTWFGNEFTIEVWVYERSYNYWSRVIDFGNGENADNVFLALSYDVSGRPVLSVGNQQLIAPQSIPLNKWVHLAATLANNTATLYVNGMEVGSGWVQAPTPINRAINYIGRSNWSADAYANAIFDDLRIWNVARSANQVRDDMCHPLNGTESNLVANWKFDEVAGNTAHDATASDLNGALVNYPSWTNSTIPPTLNLNAGLTGVLLSSVAWGDYDNDGRLDILLSGTTTGTSAGAIAQVWRNTGTGFANVTATVAPALKKVFWGSVSWTDYNNDARLDMLLTGWDVNGNPSTQLWRNNGSTFTLITTGLPAITASSAAWGDYDNDGRPDILLTGFTGGSIVSQVWRNTGNGSFTNINAGLPGVDYGSVAWGDYDNDGRLDILLTGLNGIADQIAQVWRNNGEGRSPTINAGLPGVCYSSVAWGDYDNDGRLDILLTGGGHWREHCPGVAQHGQWLSPISTPGCREFTIGSVAWGDYDNDGRLDILLSGDHQWHPLPRCGGTMGTIRSPTSTPGCRECYGSAAWGDYDNDGRVDILLAGATGVSPNYNPIAQVWRNIGGKANTPPTAPGGLTANVGTDGIRLSWSPSTDAQTPAGALTYNLRIGTNTGTAELVCPHRMPALGNAQFRQNAHFSNLTWGVYYWSVQAIDPAFGGSPFAPEQRWVAAAATLPATGVGLTTATLNGMVNPLGRQTSAWFQWGATTNYDHATPLVLQASGTTALPVTCVLTGLVLHSYHYRVVATNALTTGGLAVGADTLIPIQLARPQVVTLPADRLTSSGARLRSTVNPMERNTMAWLEYGLDSRYGQASAPVSVGRSGDIMPVSHTMSGLPWMTYHYRAVGSNSVGRTDGPDMTVSLPGHFLPAPKLSDLYDITMTQGNSTSVVFWVSSPSLEIQVRCSNPVLLPGDRLTLESSGLTPSLTLAPDPNHSGFVQVTVTATDGSRFTNLTFNVMVTPSAQYRSPLLSLTDAHVASTHTWRFHVADAGTGYTNYAVEYRSNLAPTNAWIAATNVARLPGGVFEVTNGPPQPSLGFYRARGTGFRLLMAGFDSAGVTAEEGAGPVGAVLVFNGVYTGTVTCIWTDQQGTSWTNQVAVNGTTAVIPVPASWLTDDTTLGQLRSLTLQLQAGAGFALGATTQSTVTIEENDADWQGVLQTENGNLEFTLSLVQTNGQLQGQIQSANPGFFPTNAPAQLNLRRMRSRSWPPTSPCRC